MGVNEVNTSLAYSHIKYFFQKDLSDHELLDETLHTNYATPLPNFIVISILLVFLNTHYACNKYRL